MFIEDKVSIKILNEYRLLTVENFDELSSYITEWEEIFKKKSYPVSCSPHWFISWYKAYFNIKKHKLNIVLVYKESTLLAIFPLMINIDNKRKTLQFAGEEGSDFLGFIYSAINNNHLSIVLSKIISSIDFDFFSFVKVCKSNETITILLDSLINNNIVPKIKEYDKNLIIDISIEYKDILKKILSKEKLNNKINQIKKREGKLYFKEYNKVNKILLKSIYKLHIKKWSYHKVYPQFRDKKRIRFIEELSKRINFSVYCLFLGNKLIAYRFGFLDKNIYYDWNTSYDIKYRKYSIGTILMYYIIDSKVLKINQKINFLLGNEKYKYLWATKHQTIYEISGIQNNNKIELLNTKKINDIKNKKCFLFDIDGVVFHGDNPIIDTVKGLHYLQDNNYKIGFVTNISSLSLSQIKYKFIKNNIFINNEQISTPLLVLIEHLLKNKITKCFLIGGGEKVRELLAQNNIQITSKTSEIEAVVVAFSTDFDYIKLTIAYNAISNGALFFATDEDSLFSNKDGKMPGTGWVTSSISRISGTSPIVMGKPNPNSIIYLMNKFNIESKDCLLIGDNLKTDIKAGKKAGITTCLILGGVSTIDDIAKIHSSERPDYIINSFQEIITIIKG